MKTKKIANGNIKVWYDHEEEFVIINKNELLFDTIIDANLLQRKYSKILLESVESYGSNDIHKVFIDIDDSFQNSLDYLNIIELDLIFDEFNSRFKPTYRFHLNDNGKISIMFGRFDNFQEFMSNYFGTFLLKLFACRINITLSEEKNETIRGLSGFISKFADDYYKIYLETSKSMKFKGIIRIK
jgi:hypothetical protein